MTARSSPVQPLPRAEHDTYRLVYGEGPDQWVDVALTRKKVKVLRLRVTAEGGFALSVPWHCSRGRAVDFLESQREWVARQVQRLGAGDVGPGGVPGAGGAVGLRYETGDQIPWWGVQLTLEVRERPDLVKNRARAWIEDENLVLEIETGADRERRRHVIDRLRRESLQVRLEPLLARWSTVFGVAPSAVQLRRMKSRWGSCQPQTGKLCFNLALSERDPKYLNYVVAHEFAHFFHANHGPEFHALLETYLPGERQLRRELNRRG